MSYAYRLSVEKSSAILDDLRQNQAYLMFPSMQWQFTTQPNFQPFLLWQLSGKYCTIELTSCWSFKFSLLYRELLPRRASVSKHLLGLHRSLDHKVMRDRTWTSRLKCDFLRLGWTFNLSDSSRLRHEMKITNWENYIL